MYVHSFPTSNFLMGLIGGFQGVSSYFNEIDTE